VVLPRGSCRRRSGPCPATAVRSAGRRDRPRAVRRGRRGTDRDHHGPDRRRPGSAVAAGCPAGAGDTGCRMQEINAHPPCFIAPRRAAIGEGPMAVSGLPATAEGAADQEGRSPCTGPVDATADAINTSASPR
jgi:hypothetical protein